MFKITITSGQQYGDIGAYSLITPKAKTLEQLEFETKDEAKKAIRQKCKEYGLTRQMGFYGNPKTGIELDTNF